MLMLTTSDDFLQIASLYKASAAFFVANELQVWAVLPAPTAAPQSAALLAATGPPTDGVALATILTLLAALGVVEQQGAAFRHTAASWKFLNPASASYMGNFVRLEMLLADAMTPPHLLATVQPGWQATAQPEQIYMAAMQAGADFITLSLMRAVGRLNGRLLDVGSGVGQFAIGLCQRNAALSAHLIDLPAIVPLAQAAVAAAGYSERICCSAEDITVAPAVQAAEFDYLLLARLLYLFDEQSCLAILKNYARRLKPGGTVLIYDFFLNQVAEGQEQAAQIGDGRAAHLLPYLHTMNWVHRGLNPNYTTTRMVDHLRQVGFQSPVVRPVPQLNTAIITAVW